MDEYLYKCEHCDLKANNNKPDKENKKLFANNSLFGECDDKNWTCFNCKIHGEQCDRSFYNNKLCNICYKNRFPSMGLNH